MATIVKTFEVTGITAHYTVVKIDTGWTVRGEGESFELPELDYATAAKRIETLVANLDKAQAAYDTALASYETDTKAAKDAAKA